MAGILKSELRITHIFEEIKDICSTTATYNKAVEIHVLIGVVKVSFSLCVCLQEGREQIPVQYSSRVICI
jgi:hypothetical protein